MPAGASSLDRQPFISPRRDLWHDHAERRQRACHQARLSERAVRPRHALPRSRQAGTQNSLIYVGRQSHRSHSVWPMKIGSASKRSLYRLDFYPRVALRNMFFSRPSLLIRDLALCSVLCGTISISLCSSSLSQRVDVM